MQTPVHHYNPYPRLAPFYDLMARTLLLPFGGERRFRRRALELLAVQPGARVLELGCGTGAMTRHLLDEGAQVTCVELSPHMLQRARRRAPEATFIEGDILAFHAEAPFDRALLAFVLHEMSPEIRGRTLEVARRSLEPDGLLGVLEFAGLAPWPVDPVFRGYLALAEPELARELLTDGIDPELRQAGLEVVAERRLALGTARMVVARPA